MALLLFLLPYAVLGTLTYAGVRADMSAYIPSLTIVFVDTVA